MAVIDKALLLKAQKLLVMSPFALGDFLYIKTFLEAVKQQYPHLQLDIWLDDDRNDKQVWRLARSHIMQQWIEAEPAFGKAWGCCASVSEQQRQIYAATEAAYDIVVTIPGSIGRHYIDIARNIAPAAYLVCGVSKSRWAKWFGFWYYQQADAVFEHDISQLASDHHITDRYYQWAHSIFGIVLEKPHFLPKLTPDKHFIEDAKTWIRVHFIGQHGPLFFLNHLSTNHRRDWQLSQLFALIIRLEQRQPGRYIINITSEHFDSMQQQIATLPSQLQQRIALFTVKGHFYELPALIAQCHLVITVETAIMHFATEAHIPLVAMMRQKKPYWAPLQSATSRVLFANRGKGYVCDITVDEVYDSCDNVLKHLDSATQSGT
ncbi:glycosyltransferase family 9 protein [Shewanella sp. A32]|uniref:glycosyltransferase family 9 protein n=1 Tax=Shewanella sp. A32 TaxID=3031327 RepID=UPI0023B8F599|nr:glycosyltransferase family 9 protein [Shewanella sp. A32]MDF0533493.1 glycosyltransferase family 9 protein [Shewanella sp. A32]